MKLHAVLTELTKSQMLQNMTVFVKIDKSPSHSPSLTHSLPLLTHPLSFPYSPSLLSFLTHSLPLLTHPLSLPYSPSHPSFLTHSLPLLIHPLPFLTHSPSPSPSHSPPLSPTCTFCPFLPHPLSLSFTHLLSLLHSH